MAEKVEKVPMKTLANCKPSEFLKQTSKIRKAVSAWMTATDIANIRARLPEKEPVPENATKEEKVAIILRNTEKLKKQRIENLNAILDAVLDEHPDETLEVLALCCFVDPENADDRPVGDYLTAVSQLISDEAVIGFFISLAQLGQTGILTS